MRIVPKVNKKKFIINTLKVVATLTAIVAVVMFIGRLNATAMGECPTGVERLEQDIIALCFCGCSMISFFTLAALGCK